MVRIIDEQPAKLLKSQAPVGRSETRPASGPTHDQIAARAFAIYEQSGYIQGRCTENWERAQRELIAEAAGGPFSSFDETESDVQESIPRLRNF